MPTFLEHHDTGMTYRFVIHLDEAQVDGDGNPDPAWLLPLEWPKVVPFKLDGEGAVVTDKSNNPVPAMTETEYIAQITAEAKALALHEAARRTAEPTPLKIGDPRF